MQQRAARRTHEADKKRVPSTIFDAFQHWHFG
jgi:hypothetical protein